MTSYVDIQHLGSNAIIEDDPYPYMIEQDSFYEGNNYGPFSKISRDYMAERCATNFDEVCKKYAKNCTVSGVPDEFSYMDDELIRKEGDMHIRRTAFRKYCRLKNIRGSEGECMIDIDSVNRHAPNSKKVISFSGNCATECDRFDSGSFKDDYIMDSLLEKPELGKFILDDICRVAKKNNINISNLKLKDYCSNTKQSFHTLPYVDDQPYSSKKLNKSSSLSCNCGCDFCDNNMKKDMSYDDTIERYANELESSEPIINKSKDKNKKYIFLSLFLIGIILLIVCMYIRNKHK